MIFHPNWAGKERERENDRRCRNEQFKSQIFVVSLTYRIVILRKLRGEPPLLLCLELERGYLALGLFFKLTTVI